MVMRALGEEIDRETIDLMIKSVDSVALSPQISHIARCTLTPKGAQPLLSQLSLMSLLPRFCAPSLLFVLLTACVCAQDGNGTIDFAGPIFSIFRRRSLPCVWLSAVLAFGLLLRARAFAPVVFASSVALVAGCDPRRLLRVQENDARRPRARVLSTEHRQQQAQRAGSVLTAVARRLTDSPLLSTQALVRARADSACLRYTPSWSLCI